MTIATNIRLHVADYQNKTRETLAQLADIVGTTQGAISQFMNGTTKPSMKTLIAICNQLRIDPVEIDEDFDEAMPEWNLLPPALSSFDGRRVGVGRYSLRSTHVESLRIFLDRDCEIGREGCCVLVTSRPRSTIRAQRTERASRPWRAYQRTFGGWGFYGPDDEAPLDAKSDQRWTVLEVHYA